jgi:hypothetical protein
MAGLFFAFSVAVMRVLARLPSAEGIARHASHQRRYYQSGVPHGVFWNSGGLRCCNDRFALTHAKTRKVRNLRRDNKATRLIDQYSEDWMRHVAVMMTGTVEIVEKGPEFEKGKALLETKFQQYNELFPSKKAKALFLLQAGQGGDMGLRCGRTSRTSVKLSCCRYFSLTIRRKKGRETTHGRR